MTSRFTSAAPGSPGPAAKLEADKREDAGLTIEDDEHPTMQHAADAMPAPR
ncbi:MAG: hypothetical protein AB7O77_05270 [Phycisphaerales bacterium]